MRIVWDEPKRITNLDKHGYDFADIAPGFFDGAIIRPARHGRLLVVGWLGLRAVAVVIQPMGREAVSIISMRPASKRERSLL